MSESVEYLILGGGPAGLQLGYFLGRAGRDYRILERADHVGSFFSKYPRVRNLISINKVYTGYDDPEVQLRWDWNSLISDDPELRFKHFSKEYWADPADLVRYLDSFASEQKLNIELSTSVSKIARDGEGTFVVTAEDGREFRGKRLIVATGISIPNIPPIPGIEHAEQYTEVSTDREDFVDQRVLVLGKGNSAFEIANLMIPTARMIHVASPDPLRMAWTTHYVGDLRAINNEFLDTYQLKSQNAVLNATVRKIQRAGDGFDVTVAYNMAEGEVEVIHYDRVVCCTGFKFDLSPFDETCRPELRHCGRLPEQTAAWESVNIPGLYFAGVLTAARDYRKTTSAFIHGFRYNCRALSRIFGKRYHGDAWPSELMPAEPEPVHRAMLARINRSSALWQQFGFLCDAVIIRGAQAEYLQEVPVDYLFSGECDVGDTTFTVTLEYGDKKFDNPFAVERIHRDNIRRAEASQFLHPVIRQYDGKIFVDEHHIIEDLAAEWQEEIHTKPLLHWLRLHHEDRRRDSA